MTNRCQAFQRNDVARTIVEVNWGFIALVGFLARLLLPPAQRRDEELCAPNATAVDLLNDGDTPTFV